MSQHPSQAPIFQERPREPIVRDGLWLALVPGALGALAAGTGAFGLAALGLGLAGFVLFFFRNPERVADAGPDAVLAAADGRVIEVGEVEDEEGEKRLRIGVFLSIFDVHVNRAPVSGRVVAVERRAGRALAAFNPRAERENARATLVLETPGGDRVSVVQIVGLVARRILCHPRPGEWLERGVRYGLIRFGSRTDVLLPPRAEPCVTRGERVRGGETVIARLEGAAP